jgi:hypothetical protein
MIKALMAIFVISHFVPKRSFNWQIKIIPKQFSIGKRTTSQPLPQTLIPRRHSNKSDRLRIEYRPVAAKSGFIPKNGDRLAVVLH